MRDKILRSAAQGHIETRLQPADWAGLLAADEVFVCNSLIGVWPLRELEGRTWTAPGSITRRLMRALAHPQPGGPP
jgi:4-amino-4-deoxychorismate lyase